VVYYKKSTKHKNGSNRGIEEQKSYKTNRKQTAKPQKGSVSLLAITLNASGLNFLLKGRLA
jgi:hypothetical protein